jgi:hypothetical protein
MVMIMIVIVTLLMICDMIQDASPGWQSPGHATRARRSAGRTILRCAPA